MVLVSSTYLGVIKAMEKRYYFRMNFLFTNSNLHLHDDRSTKPRDVSKKSEIIHLIIITLFVEF